MKPINPLKLVKQNKMKKVIIALNATFVSMAAFGETPDAVQIKDNYGFFENKSGAFDLSSEETSFVSAASMPLYGTSPGIRTFASVDNTEGVIRQCSNVTIHYQILDIDGDWDSEYDLGLVRGPYGDEYKHLSTKSTIQWGIAVDGEIKWTDESNKYNSNDLASYIKNENLTLQVPKTIQIDGNTINTAGKTLAYRIIPWTMFGSYPPSLGNWGEDPSNAAVQSAEFKETNYVQVKELDKSVQLNPGELLAEGQNLVIKDIDVLDELTINGIQYPGLTQNDLNISGRSFINTLEIQADESCLPVANRAVEFKLFGVKLDASGNVDMSTNREFALNGSFPSDYIYYPKVFIKGEDKTKAYKNNITWSFYYVQDGQIKFIDELSHFTPSGRLDIEYLNAKEEVTLEDFDFEKNKESFRQETIDSKIRERFVECQVAAEPAESTLCFTLQKSNNEALWNGEPNFSEQGLKLQLNLVLPDNSQ